MPLSVSFLNGAKSVRGDEGEITQRTKTPQKNFHPIPIERNFISILVA
jgi:hypothetical protein